MTEHTDIPSPDLSATTVPNLRRLQRSRSNRMLAGVSGGLARYFEIHPAVFRVGFVVLTLLGGAGLLIYAAAAIVIPDEGKDDSIATAALRDRRDRPWPLIGLGFLAVAGAVLLSQVTLWPQGDAWILFLIAGALILWITRQPAADPAASPSDLAAEDSRRVRRALRRTVVAVVALLALLVASAAVVAAVFDVQLDRGVGERSYVVSSASDLRDEYRLGVGELDLDLGAASLPVGETRIATRVDVGELRIVVPADASLQVRAEAGLGEIRLPNGLGAEGRNVDSELSEQGERVLVLEASVGLGSVDVERALP